MYHDDWPDGTPWWVRNCDYLFAAAIVGLLIWGIFAGQVRLENLR